MTQQDFWRTEIWHPLSVHFPIVMLLLGTLFLGGSLLRSSHRDWLSKSSFILLIGGALTVWLSVYTGNLADGVVARKICDPTILKDHEIAGQITSYIFSGVALLLLIQIKVSNTSIKSFIIYLALAAALIGCYYLTTTAHIGATLVYDQGAGVKGYPTDCN